MQWSGGTEKGRRPTRCSESGLALWLDSGFHRNQDLKVIPEEFFQTSSFTFFTMRFALNP